ncbi:MAG: hypothetical protein PUP91_14830 [Rhizonema sp. PD37]|nr:hypothetical protein [Rhizonema sp. PD37]
MYFDSTAPNLWRPYVKSALGSFQGRALRKICGKARALGVSPRQTMEASTHGREFYFNPTFLSAGIIAA